MRAPRGRIRSRVPLSQYPRSVDTVLYVGYRPTISGLTNVFCADIYLGSQQAGENVQSVRSLCSFKVRAQGAFFMTLTWDLDDSLDSKRLQVAADCSGARGVRQKAADSESTPSSSTALSRSSSRGEARLVTKSDRRSRPSRVFFQRLQW
jgi:hypothetical protein